MIRKEGLNGLIQVLPSSLHPIFKTSILLAVIMAVACSATVLSWAKADTKDEKNNVKSGTGEVRVNNFGKVADFYYRGAQPKDDEYGQLATIGIKTVIDLRDDAKDSAKTLAEHAGLKYINLPMSDKSYPSHEIADKFLSLVNDEQNWPVYVHCAGGRHRTGAMTAVFRMKVQGWDIDQAYDEMKDYDFYTRWGHKAMKKFVFDYYRELTQGRNQAQKSQPAESIAIPTSK